MRCNECYWADNCPEYGEECMDFYSISVRQDCVYEEPQPSGWSYKEWYTYIAEYSDGNIDYEEDENWRD